jgi:hypothetical protein
MSTNSNGMPKLALPGISIARIMVSIAAPDGLELHLELHKFEEGENDRSFITSPPGSGPPGSPDAGDKSVFYEVLKPLYGNPSDDRHERYTKL